MRMRRGVPACAIGFGKPIGSIVQILLETMNPGVSLSPALYNLPPSPTTPPPPLTPWLSWVIYVLGRLQCVWTAHW